jgi:excisionase family DNA binding protein
LSAITPSVTPTTPFNELPQWLTVDQVATYMGVSTYTVYQGLRSGDVPYRRFGRKLLFIPREFLGGATVLQGKMVNAVLNAEVERRFGKKLG